MKQTKKDIDYKLRCDKLESQLNYTKKALKKKALKLIDAEDRKEIENRVREQQELIHRKTYENTIRRQSSSQPNTC